MKSEKAGYIPNGVKALATALGRSTPPPPPPPPPPHPNAKGYFLLSRDHEPGPMRLIARKSTDIIQHMAAILVRGGYQTAGWRLPHRRRVLSSLIA